MRSVSLLMSANIFNAGIGLILSVLTLRYISPDILGVIYPLISISMIINQFGDWGTSNSFIKLASTHYSVNRDKAWSFFHAALKIKLYLCLAVLLICVPLSSQISRWTFAHTKHSDLVTLIIFVTSLQILSSFTTSTLQIEGRFKTLSWVKILPNLLKLTFLALIIFLGHITLINVLIGFLIVPVMSFLISIPFTDLKKIFNHDAKKEDFHELIKVSRWIALSAIANAFLNQMDILMMTSMGGNEELVRLLGGQRLAGIFPILSMSLVTVLLPKVSSMVSKAELNFYYRKTFLITTVFCLFLLCFLPLSKWIIPFILGSKYTSSIDVFNLLMIANLLGIMITPLSLVLYKLNKEPIFVLMNVAQLIITIIGNWILIPIYGAYASAIMVILCKIIAFLFVYYQLWKEGILFYHHEK